MEFLIFNFPRVAEKQLELQEQQPQFAVLLLQMVENQSFPQHIQFSAALLFKNFIKRQWPEEPAESRLKEADRDIVKQNIVSVMIRVPEKLQIQLSEAVSVMAYNDFPEYWPNLIDDLVSRLSPTDYHVNAGVLQTAHSIFKRYRHQFRSDELFTELNMVFSKFNQPYLQLFTNTDSLIDQHAGNADALKVLFSCLLLLCKIYFSLNCQDLPAFFEDNMSSFMPLFVKYLNYSNPLLQSDDDNEAGPVEKVKTAICEIVDMYARKYEEEFTHLPQFVSAIWQNLTNSGLEGKYDQLVSTGITFISSVAKHARHRAMFEAPESLQSICENIIMPNIRLRESDEELFEDDPIEYIRRDLEGSDSDTRRRSAIDLIRSLSVQFEANLTAMLGGYITQSLQKFTTNPSANWKEKDTAIYLLIAITAQAATAQLGATKTNQNISIPSIFDTNIKQDLESAVDSGKVHPVLVVDALKFLNTFRHQLDRQQIGSTFPLVIRHLASSNYVVHTYAAVCLERMLCMKQPDGSSMFSASDLKPYLESLLMNLFSLMERGQTPEKISENDYLIKTVMRIISIAQKEILPYTSTVLEKLTRILEVISKNPSNPKFNHFVFESIGSLVRYLCAADRNLVAEFEKLLHPPIQAILQMGIAEFTPYVLQLLAQLLDFHTGQTIPTTYQAILPPLLLPVLWENNGNVPALVRLLDAYLERGGAEIAKTGKLPAFLGIFQKLVASRLNDQYGFLLLNSIFMNVPIDMLKQFVPQIFNILLVRLQSGKTTKYTNGLLKFVCAVVCFTPNADGASLLVQTLETIQPNMFTVLMQNIFIAEMKNLGKTQDRKECVTAFMKLITACPVLMTPASVPLKAAMLNAVVDIAKTPISKQKAGEGDEHEFHIADMEEAGYQAQFVELSSASKPQPDKLADIQDLAQFVKMQLHAAAQSNNAQHIAAVLGTASDECKKTMHQLGISQ